MTGADRRTDGTEPNDRGGSPVGPATTGAEAEAEAAELIAQLRELAGPDPATVRTVVSDVLAALDRVSGGALREQLPYDSELRRGRGPAADGGDLDRGADIRPAATTNGHPVEPHPAQPYPPSPHPVEPRPTDPQPGRPGPADPHPERPAPAGPHPVEPRPTDPHPVEPGPTDPHPAEPGPVTPGPLRRGPTQRSRPQQRDGDDRT
ncbi:hypothetical protein [Plantactinospora sp. B24E8]|uniref:hypothetical protein n=1 Tax=Plantactinospora sp. B24E8 TaxID=3153567 RepID=UPI00325F6105